MKKLWGREGTATNVAANIWTTAELYQWVGTIKHFGLTIVPDDWVPWLIWDLGLEDVVPYVRDMRQALAEGPAWQRRRGTPAGISIGIGWVQSAGTVAPSDQRHNWWEFQVGFAEPASDIAQIRQLDGIIRLSKASEDELFRMYSPGSDHRPVRMDMHRMGGLMDGYSGVPLWDGGPLISFGWTSTIFTVSGSSAAIGTDVTVSIARSWFDGMRLDADQFGERPDATAPAGIEIIHATETYAWAGDSWPVEWPESWAASAEPTVTATAWEAL